MLLVRSPVAMMLSLLVLVCLSPTLTFGSLALANKGKQLGRATLRLAARPQPPAPASRGAAGLPRSAWRNRALGSGTFLDPLPRLEEPNSSWKFLPPHVLSPVAAQRRYAVLAGRGGPGDPAEDGVTDKSAGDGPGDPAGDEHAIVVDEDDLGRLVKEIGFFPMVPVPEVGSHDPCAGYFFHDHCVEG